MTEKTEKWVTEQLEKVEKETRLVREKLEQVKIEQVTRLDYKQKYKPTTLVLFFFTFSIFGWLWEVGLHIVQYGEFVNRGTLWGPWLPIYGVGGVLALLFFRKFFDQPVLTFFLTMTGASVVEYFTSWYIEATKGVRYWDYSNYPLNINGRICLEGSVVFGLGGCAVIYFAAPLLAKYYEKIKRYITISLCVVLVGSFAADMAYTGINPHVGAGITDQDWEAEMRKRREAQEAEERAGQEAPQLQGPPREMPAGTR